MREGRQRRTGNGHRRRLAEEDGRGRGFALTDAGRAELAAYRANHATIAERDDERRVFSELTVTQGIAQAEALIGWCDQWLERLGVARPGPPASPNLALRAASEALR